MQTSKKTRKQIAAMEVAKAVAHLFRFPSSKADQRYFKIEIQNWLTTHPNNRPSWNQLLERMVMARNTGKDLKYCYFNDHHQRVFVLHAFAQWAVYTRSQIVTTLKKHYGQSQ